MDEWQKQWWKQIEKSAAEVEGFWTSVGAATESLVDEVSDNVGIFLEEFQSDFIGEFDSLIQDFVEIIIDTSDEIDSVFGEDWVNFTDEDFTSISYHAPSVANNPACINCANYHGQSYNGNLLVCGMHPSGWSDDSCPDWEKESAP